jgi:hypothetical protein
MRSPRGASSKGLAIAVIHGLALGYDDHVGVAQSRIEWRCALRRDGTAVRRRDSAELSNRVVVGSEASGT